MTNKITTLDLLIMHGGRFRKKINHRMQDYVKFNLIFHFIMIIIHSILFTYVTSLH